MCGKRQNVKEDINNSWKALSWLNQKYPNSIFVANHPSRHNGGKGEVRAEHLRKIQMRKKKMIIIKKTKIW